MATFADRIRTLREKARLTQEGLAHELGVTKNTVSVWERGLREPDNERMIDIAQYFDVPFTYLCGASEVKDWPTMTDEEAALIAREEEKEIEDHMMRIYRDLSSDMQTMVRSTISTAYRIDKARKTPRSQQE